MKYSDVMLKGFAKAEGRKAIGARGEIGDDGKLHVCAIGAVALQIDGDPWGDAGDVFVNSEAYRAFEREFGINLAGANNGYSDSDAARDCDSGKPGLPIDVIAGMLKAIGH
jgi:hypothetical protein